MLQYERGKLTTIIQKLDRLRTTGALNNHERDLLEAAKQILMIAYRAKDKP